MNRRRFLSGLGASIIGFQAYNEYKSYSKKVMPPLVHNVGSRPLNIKPISENKLQYNFNNLDDSIDEVLVTQNKYGENSTIYQEEYYDVKNLDNVGKINFDSITTADLIAYTIYGYDSNDLTYLGESEPIKIKNKNIEKQNLEYLSVNVKPKRRFKRMYRRGYFEIKFDKYNPRDKYNYYVSKQRYYNTGRYYTYHTPQENFPKNSFLKYLADLIKENTNSDNEYHLLKSCRDFVHHFEWSRDIDSIGIKEYIREPSKTAVEGIGDCKDTTYLLNGLIENILNIDTAIVLSENHMASAVRLSDISDNTLNRIKNNADDIYYVDAFDKTYIPIETTASHNKIGETSRESIYAVYDNEQFQVIDLNKLWTQIKSSRELI